MRWPWRKPEIKYQDIIRVNTLPLRQGGEKAYECMECASIYFNDYQYNAGLLSPARCAKCGCEVRPTSMRTEE